jgi:hypothetical protein
MSSWMVLFLGSQDCPFICPRHDPAVDVHESTLSSQRTRAPLGQTARDLLVWHQQFQPSGRDVDADQLALADGAT